jgi:hypothetical protein
VLFLKSSRLTHYTTAVQNPRHCQWLKYATKLTLFTPWV